MCAAQNNQAKALREEVGALTATEKRRSEQALREAAVCAAQNNQAKALREKVGALTATEERRVEQALREGAVCAAQQQPSQSTEREGGGTELCLFVPPCRYNVEGDVGSTCVKTPVPLKHLNIIMPKEEQASLSTDLYHN